LASQFLNRSSCFFDDNETLKWFSFFSLNFLPRNFELSTVGVWIRFQWGLEGIILVWSKFFGLYFCVLSLNFLPLVIGSSSNWEYNICHRFFFWCSLEFFWKWIILFWTILHTKLKVVWFSFTSLNLRIRSLLKVRLVAEKSEYKSDWCLFLNSFMVNVKREKGKEIRTLYVLNCSAILETKKWRNCPYQIASYFQCLLLSYSF
jgi:hypothetical protein